MSRAVVSRAVVSRRKLVAAVVAAALVAFGFAFGRRPATPEDPLRAALLAARSELEWPGLDVRSAARTLGSRERAIAFVKDEVALASYAGAWQGAEGTLRTRVANAADRAVLLAALLRELGVDVRLARGDWPRYATPHRPAPPAREIAALARLRALVPEKVRPEVAPLDTGALAAEVSASSVRLAPLVAKAWPQLELDAAPKKTDLPPPRPEKDWVWVQVKKGGEWEDVDVLFAEEKRPPVVTAPWEPARTRIAFEVDAVDSEERRHAVTSWEGPAPGVLGRTVALSLLPGTCRVDELEKLPSPEAVKLWAPCLQVGGELVATGAFSREGVVLHAKDGEVALERASVPLVAREPAKTPARSRASRSPLWTCGTSRGSTCRSACGRPRSSPGAATRSRRATSRAPSPSSSSRPSSHGGP